MIDLKTLTNRELMSAHRKTIDEMNRFKGWQDRTEIDLITKEIKRRMEAGIMGGE